MNRHGHFEYVKELNLEKPTDEITEVLTHIMRRSGKDSLSAARFFLRKYREGKFMSSSVIVLIINLMVTSHLSGREHTQAAQASIIFRAILASPSDLIAIVFNTSSENTAFN